MIVENDGVFAMSGIAFIVAVGEPCFDFSQIARSDGLTAQHTEGLRAGRPAVHQDESHMGAPEALAPEWGVAGKHPLLAAVVAVSYQ
jgi:hypothetical protein